MHSQVEIPKGNHRYAFGTQISCLQSREGADAGFAVQETCIILETF